MRILWFFASTEPARAILRSGSIAIGGVVRRRGALQEARRQHADGKRRPDENRWARAREPLGVVDDVLNIALAKAGREAVDLDRRLVNVVRDRLLFLIAQWLAGPTHGGGDTA